MNTQGVLSPLVNNSNLSTYYLENSWHPNQDNSNVLFPRLTSLASPNNYRSSSLWFYDASFLKLRNCEIYYKLPKNVVSNLKMEQLKLYVKGENLFSIDNMPSNLDPENYWGAYPTLPGFAFGASFVF